MVYNFNQGIGWASSGIEYAQAYRCKALRNIGQKARFVFTDMFPGEALAHMTRNLGFRDEEVIWLYQFFTDCEISPVTYTLAQLEKTFGSKPLAVERKAGTVRYEFEGNVVDTAYLAKENSDLVHRVEISSNGYMIRKDYFTNRKNYSEYYAPLDGQAKLYYRRFFNRDGTAAYEEIVGEKDSVFRFPHRMIFSKGDLIGLMVEQMHLTREDLVIIDRNTNQGQAILENVGEARVASVIHAEHFSEDYVTPDTILWNNYYEYDFAQNRHFDFYIASTDAQNELLRQQFHDYMGVEPAIVTIPVGSIDRLRRPDGPRKKYSMITASRLASEKHVDWLVEAAVQAREMIPDLTLDIYGKGIKEEPLRKQIEQLGAQSYIHLMGQYRMDEVYKNYELYVAGSTSEGFGLTLMEAVGSGLPIVGFDVHYGNQTFIDDGKNGYLVPYAHDMDGKAYVQLLAEAMVRVFTEADLEAFHQHSYEKAKEYMTCEVEKRWEKLLCEKK